MLCALTFVAYLGRLGWFFDVWSHFRVQYLLGLVVCLVLLGVLRDRLLLVAAGACFVVNAAEIVPWYFGANDAKADEGAPRLTLLCANVWNFNDEHERFLRLIEERDPDVVVVLEATREWVAALESIAQAYPYSEMHTRQDPFGIALYSRLPLEDARIVQYGSAGVPSIVANVQLGGETVTILATHPLPPRRPRPWRLRNEQLEAIAAARDDFGERLIVAGDFNASPFSPCLRHFVATMRRSGFALRFAGKGRGIKPTWPTFNRLLLTPLDHIFVTDNLVVTAFRTGPHIGSDHLPIQATVRLSE